MRRHALPLGAALLVATAIVQLGAHAPLASADTVRSCPGSWPLANTGAWYGDLSVRNMSCRRARQALRRARLVSGSVRVPSYTCRLIGTYRDGGVYRCTRGSAAMRFSAGG